MTKCVWKLKEYGKVIKCPYQVQSRPIVRYTAVEAHAIERLAFCNVCLQSRIVNNLRVLMEIEEGKAVEKTIK